MATVKNQKVTSKGLYRSETNKIIAGICGGIGEYLSIDPVIFRIIFILGTIFGGWGIIVYIILWIVIPSESKAGSINEGNVKENVEEIKLKAKNFATDIASGNDSKVWIGIIIALVGVMFLFSNFGIFYIFDFAKFWPLILVGLGLLIIMKNEKK